MEGGWTSAKVKRCVFWKAFSNKLQKMSKGIDNSVASSLFHGKLGFGDGSITQMWPWEHAL